jgi:hypothetical protein
MRQKTDKMRGIFYDTPQKLVMRLLALNISLLLRALSQNICFEMYEDDHEAMSPFLQIKIQYKYNLKMSVR